MLEDDDTFFNLPVYQAFTKELLIGGLPVNMALLLFGGILLSVLLFHNIILSLIFLIIYFILFLIIKFSPKFDTKMLDILMRINLKKYINY